MIVENCFGACFNIGFDGHSGNNTKFIGLFCQPRFLEFDFSTIVGVALFIQIGGGRYLLYIAFNRSEAGPVVTVYLDISGLAGVDMANIIRRNTCFHNQVIAGWDDLHNDQTGIHHGIDSGNREPLHYTCHRGLNMQPGDVIL